MTGKACLLFDFDGVIVDSYDAVLKIIQSKQQITSAEYKRRFLKPIADGTKKLSPQSLKEYFTTYLSRLSDMPIVPGMAELVMELAKQHDLFIISSTTNRPINAFLQKHGLSAAIAEVLGYDVEPDKTKKMQYVLKAYNYRPQQALFITDTVGDVEEGRGLGIKAAAVSWGYHDKETLEQATPWKIASDPLHLAGYIQEFISRL